MDHLQILTKCNHFEKKCDYSEVLFSSVKKIFAERKEKQKVPEKKIRKFPQKKFLEFGSPQKMDIISGSLCKCDFWINSEFFFAKISKNKFFTIFLVKNMHFVASRFAKQNSQLCFITFFLLWENIYKIRY